MTFRKETLAEGIDDRWVTIYALCQPINKWHTGPVRYVGKTVDTPSRRLRDHRYASRRKDLPIHRWLRKHAHEPDHIIHLERVPPGSDWAARERFWISKYRNDGCVLLNITDGGEGLAGRVMTADHKNKIADALRTGGHFDCEKCGTRFWRKRNEIEKGNNRFCSRACSNRRHR